MIEIEISSEEIMTKSMDKIKAKILKKIPLGKIKEGRYKV
jgi:hypothetical protein